MRVRIPNQVLAIAAVALGISMVYTNCQQDVGFDDVASLKSQGDPNPPVVPPTPDDVKTTCQNAAHISKVASMRFPKPNVTCDWERDGNLARRNGYFQARIEQRSEIDLPAGAVVCNMVFSFNKQQFLYDDHFMMTFDGAMLASSYNFSGVLQKKNGLLQYDWSRIGGTQWLDNSASEGVFCAAVKDSSGAEYGGRCNWPSTDVEGNIEMAFPKEVFYAFMAQDSARTKHEFKFVSIGDNDDGDCEHSEVNFNVLVEYVLPKR